MKLNLLPSFLYKTNYFNKRFQTKPQRKQRLYKKGSLYTKVPENGNVPYKPGMNVAPKSFRKATVDIGPAVAPDFYIDGNIYVHDLFP
jgi:hypothetical protein